MKKLKKKEKIILIAVIVLAIIAIIAAAFMSGGKETDVSSIETTPLTKGNIQSTISATGTIESTNSEQVSNTSGLPIDSIEVAVGNWVEQGDVLCTLYNENAGQIAGMDGMTGAASSASNEEWIDVTAPISGTVTAINAQNGGLANGALFTIENTNSLRIRATLKESDLASVKTSMPVTFKTDATGDTEYQGTVQSIAPTAVQSAALSATGGGSAMTGTSSSNPQFEALISIDSAITNLLIGMKADLTIIVENKQDVYSVDYNAITSDANGNPCILAATDEREGVYTVTEIPVTTGTESDFAVEISGEGLSDGLQVITDVDSVTAGQKVTLQSADQGGNQ